MSLTSGLIRALDIGKFPIEWSGSTSPTFLAWVLASANLQRPQLVICNREKTAEKLASDLRTLRRAQETVLLGGFDESPYSGLYPSASSIHNRMHFLWRAQNSKGNEVFISSIEGLLQKTMPLEVFKNFNLILKKGEEVDLATLCEQLSSCGYSAVPMVEDSGTFSRRGDILDIFSPTYEQPIRIELFGDQIESLRLFDSGTQRSESELEAIQVIPAREIILLDESTQRAQSGIKSFLDERGIPKDSRDNLLEPLKQNVFFHGIDYWLSFFYEKTANPFDYFNKPPLVFWLDSIELTKAADALISQFQDKFNQQIRARVPVCDPSQIYDSFDLMEKRLEPHSCHLKKIHIENTPSAQVLNSKVFDLSDLSTITRAAREAKKDFFEPAVRKLLEWKSEKFFCSIFSATQTQAQRIKYLLETHQLDAVIADTEDINFDAFRKEQADKANRVHIFVGPLTDGLRIPEDSAALIREEDIFGERERRDTRKTKGTLEKRTQALSFGDLSPNDLIVHNLHGVGIYDGLKKLNVQNVENEYIQLRYKDNDKLYLPVYRISQIQKYSSGGGAHIVDKLGSTSWQKAKVKVRGALKDIASELLNLYARRASASGFSFSAPDDDFREFEATFNFDETPDQAKAIEAVLKDMHKPNPMDRLVCGDVGFGKTEVAIRASYKAVQDHKQVAILVPTTILAFQHYNTFKKRFADTAVSVRMISRFTPPTENRKTLDLAKGGRLDVLIGTHRLLSKDVVFKDLGLLIIDEEQKFGVTHKEKIKKFKTQIDVLTLSATPIPRTLNMSLLGVRDLSLINTPPENRLAIRTFISRFDEEVIRKAILSEVQRDGQVFFIHNRVQSIEGFAQQIRTIVPEVRLRVAHGQMQDEILERTMLDFYNHEFDVLVCTTIIESGLDIPTANTIVVDRADTFGLSQLYQLRGRVGRSKERSYAYLLIPAHGGVEKVAQERLKILQEHSDLGSGFHIAHHDLELRGSGNILGEDQSGHIAAVGYELYMELLEQALAEAKGEPLEESVEPEINLRVTALFPDTYIEDIRIRLGYYKLLSEIQDEGDLDKIEHDLVDRFGALPEPVTNLFGIMLIRKYCKDLGIKDISSGPKNVNLAFSNATKVAPEAIIRLTTKQINKYQLTPDQTLIIRLNSTSWPAVLEELKGLKKSLF